MSLTRIPCFETHCYLTSWAATTKRLTALAKAEGPVSSVVAIVVVRVPVRQVHDPRVVSVVGHRRRGP